MIRTDGPALKRRVQFVVVTSKFCNLRCRYCYELPDLGDRAAMSGDQLQRMYRSIADFYARLDGPVEIEFVWHGGEPLLINPDFYWRQFDEQSRIFDDPKVTLRNCVQTNLTILNDRVLKLLREGFDGIGVSIDLFSGLRVNVNGRDSQPVVLEHMDALRDADVGFGCITVLSRQNVPYLAEMYRFFADSGIQLRMLPVHRGADDGQNDAHSLTEAEVLAAYIELFEMWIDDTAPMVMEPLYSHTKHVISALGGDRLARYDRSRWESIYVVNTDGYLYSFSDRFDVAVSHGNLFEDALQTIVDGEGHRRSIAAADARMRATCTRCRHFKHACSGYPIAEESTARHDGATCTRERGILDYIERRVVQLGIVGHDGVLDPQSPFYPRFAQAQRVAV